MGDKTTLFSKGKIQGKGNMASTIMDQIDKNDLHLDLPPYKCLYLVSNVKNINLFNPSLMKEEVNFSLKNPYTSN